MCIHRCGDVQRYERPGCTKGRGVTEVGRAGLLGEAAQEENLDGPDSQEKEVGGTVRRQKWPGLPEQAPSLVPRKAEPRCQSEYWGQGASFSQVRVVEGVAGFPQPVTACLPS